MALNSYDREAVESFLSWLCDKYEVFTPEGNGCILYGDMEYHTKEELLSEYVNHKSLEKPDESKEGRRSNDYYEGYWKGEEDKLIEIYHDISNVEFRGRGLNQLKCDIGYNEWEYEQNQKEEDDEYDY